MKASMLLSLVVGVLALAQSPARQLDQGFWANMGSGDHAGASGIFTLDHTEGRDLVIGQGGGYSPGCWRAFRHDPAKGDYRQVHGEPPSVVLGYDYMRTVTSGDVDPAPGKEIVVGIYKISGDTNGTVEIYNGTTKEMIRSFRVSNGTDLFKLENLLTYDVDGDGMDEILVNAVSPLDNGLLVMKGDGTFCWSCRSPGDRMAIGQLDDDPAMELAGLGRVIDLGQRTEQWSGVGIGSNVLIRDVDGDGVGELIRYGKWDGVHATDVRTGKELWSYQRPGGTSGVLIDDLDADGVDELVVGDAQWGGLHVLRMGSGTPQELYQINEPGYDPNKAWTSSGTPGLLLADTDSDGRKELVWCYGGGGGSGEGPTQIFIYDPIARAFEWISPWRESLDGSPKIGDVTGDGKPDLVTTSRDGSILVYDTEKLALLNPPKLVADRPQLPFFGMTTGLCDIDGDGCLEIAAADEHALRIFKFRETGGFEEVWHSTEPGFLKQFESITVCDVESDGALEVVVTRKELAWSDLPEHVQIYDFQTGRLKWSSADVLPKVETSIFTSSVVSSLIKDTDGDGHLEIVVALSYGHLAIIDLASHELEVYDGQARYSQVLDVPGAPSFQVLEIYQKDRYTPTVGNLHEVAFGSEGYELHTIRSFGEFGTEIKALARAPQDRWWVITKWQVGLLAPDGSWDWQSENYEDIRTDFAFLTTDRGPELYVGWLHGILGFKIGHLFEKPEIRVETTQTAAESGREGHVIFSRNDAGLGASRIRFTVAGTANLGVDFMLAGATDTDGDGIWEFDLNDSSDHELRFFPESDALAEGDETVVLQVLDNPSFVRAEPGPIEFVIEDDEPRLSVSALKSEASESAKGVLEFLIERTGNLAVPLTANFRVSGTADSKDFTASDRVLQFKAGVSSLKLRFTAKADKLAEVVESVTVELSGGPSAWVNPAAASATGWILDSQATVRLSAANPARGGVEVVLSSEGTLTTRTAVKLQIQSVTADGKTSRKVVTANVGPGGEPGRYLVKSGKSFAKVIVTLLEGPAYHRAGEANLEFDLPALVR